MRISRPSRSRRRGAAAVVALVTCSTVVTGQHLAVAGGGPAPSGPAPTLDWSPCVQGSPYDCATAKVPLDYDDPGGRTIELAVVRRKATDPGRRIGSLFFNPGGPGGPGTVQMPQNYEAFPREVRERFDIVSWDPRGIGNSTAVNCFGSPEAAAEWAGGHAVGFPVGAKERATWIEAYRDLSRRCERRNPELLRHVSTADTARDLDGLRRAVGDAQLTYLGISYGTYLGATYANLYPDKVRALVLDSDWDPQAWTNRGSDDARLPSFLRLGSDRSAAATIDKFLELCGSTTTARCAFSAGSPKATRDKFDRLLRRLRDEPVGPYTYSATVDDMVNSLYIVHPGWTLLAGRLQDLWQGRTPEPPPLPPAPPVPNPNPYAGEEQGAAVLCADSPNPRDPEAYHSFEEESAARNGVAGRFWTWASSGCATWPAVAAHRYRGPWNKPTAHPILVVGTGYDPSTPYTAAQAMASELADARLLTNDGYGHTALLNPSSCVQGHEIRYLIDGTLPPVGTTCRQDTPPFAAPEPNGGIATGGGWLARTSATGRDRA
ncbi:MULTISPECIES: alpha/beta hydrolase [Streptomyces]|uniref:Alpha/beta hydrolase n=1 Tax=Streptomyces koelreuteriae TaxID=2838015 RepID=A0ABX8FYX4_9ACTN|nr:MULTISPECIES: alpha/beta hydrolase [Streptomyces]QWB26435.1 alpha/beta hydrolase [Streptomyces koelreuteriae]UUA09516.1 alpha/beta hydrolase [Streptomyces koelreuteriae]UUA17120.1 alpha/beta hydrolase [Streptomyces sp. CRCS-T-1]